MNKPYKVATRFLLKQIPHPDPQSILNAYLDDGSLRACPSISKLYRGILSSAQNANMKASVIGGSIGGFDRLGPALFDFNPAKVLRAFRDDPKGLLKHIHHKVQVKGQMRDGEKSIWPRFCKTALSAAAFLQQFRDGEDFWSWAHQLYEDERSMAALPLIISNEIEGIGYALACDFLKDAGFTGYGKPDVHIKEIFAGLKLCPPKASSYQVQKTIARIAKDEGASAFNVDKVFWLIGSGKFYKHHDLGKDGRIGRMKEVFLAECGVSS